MNEKLPTVLPAGRQIEILEARRVPLAACCQCCLSHVLAGGVLPMPVSVLAGRFVGKATRLSHGPCHPLLGRPNLQGPARETPAASSTVAPNVSPDGLL